MRTVCGCILKAPTPYCIGCTASLVLILLALAALVFFFLVRIALRVLALQLRQGKCQCPGRQRRAQLCLGCYTCLVFWLALFFIGLLLLALAWNWLGTRRRQRDLLNLDARDLLYVVPAQDRESESNPFTSLRRFG